MRFTFLSAHKVKGIRHCEPSDIELYRDDSKELTATLTNSLDTHWTVLDKQSALCSLMLKGWLGGADGELLSQTLDEGITAVQVTRKQTYDDNPFVVIRICGTVEWTEPNRIVEKCGDQVCFGGYDKLKLEKEMQPYVSGVLTGIRTGSGGDYSFKRIGEGSFLTTADGKTLHSFNATFGAVSLSVSSGLTAQQLLGISSDIGVILRQKTFRRITGLHLHSIEESTDEVVAFLSAWTALERFINGIFPEYQSKLATEISAMSSNGAQNRYLRRLEEIAEGKHKVTDKFTLILAFLADDGDGEKSRFETDLGAFKKLKKLRDGLAHGEQIDIERSQTHETQKLFDEYFRRYLRGISTKD